MNRIPPTDLESLLAQANRANVEAMLVRLELARTMIWAARTGNAKRMHDNARRHYDRAAALLPMLTLNSAQGLDIREQLSAVRAQLVAVGETF